MKEEDLTVGSLLVSFNQNWLLKSIVFKNHNENWPLKEIDDGLKNLNGVWLLKEINESRGPQQMREMSALVIFLDI